MVFQLNSASTSTAVASATASSPLDLRCNSRSIQIVSLALGLIEDDFLFSADQMMMINNVHRQAGEQSSVCSPVDQVTTCFDDSCSVSSMSSFGEGNDHDEHPSPLLMSPQNVLCVKPRSIFQPYWEKNGGAAKRSGPSSSLRRSLFSDDSESSTSEDGEVSVGTYERTLKGHEGSKTTATTTMSLRSALCTQQQPRLPAARRSIFGGTAAPEQVQSEPCLQLKSHHNNSTVEFRKTQSSYSLFSRPKRSCLRRGRFSNSEGNYNRSESFQEEIREIRREASSSSCGSVSFSEDLVNVVVYQRPVEHYAADGWSKMFV